MVDVYKRDLVIEDYFIGYLLHPYVSLYTGRGCRSRCTFCLWPQTIGGHRYRTRTPGERDRGDRAGRRSTSRRSRSSSSTTTRSPTTCRAPRRSPGGLGKLGVTWSCNAKAIVPYDTLKVLKDNGLRLLLVGYETGSQQILNNIRKGTRVDVARRFTADCHKLGVVIHGTFIVGLPGETPETIESTIRFANEINPHTIQVSLAAPYPGTELYQQAVANGWLDVSGQGLVGSNGVQISSISYPNLSKQEIFKAVEKMYKSFYFRPKKIVEMTSEMIRSPEMLRRRLREAVEFFRFLTARQDAA